jgi:hypothetical protein
MRNISNKFFTNRTAKAQTSVKAHPSTIERVRQKTVPKGDVFEIARTAALSGVKRCDELVPFCHSVPLDWAEIRFEVKDDEIIIMLFSFEAEWQKLNAKKTFEGKSRQKACYSGKKKTLTGKNVLITSRRRVVYLTLYYL